jgi:hypothetical protein
VRALAPLISQILAEAYRLPAHAAVAPARHLLELAGGCKLAAKQSGPPPLAEARNCLSGRNIRAPMVWERINPIVGDQNAAAERNRLKRRFDFGFHWSKDCPPDFLDKRAAGQD